MAKRKMNLSKPFAIGPGVSQTQVEVEQTGFLRDNFIEVITIQGNRVSLPMTAQDNAFLESVENRVKAELEK